MKICGIIAEYNPFHNGHAYHLQETRKKLGANTAIICAMSGNYVQRGDFAILEKYQRAEMAVRCGADLVLELPLAACLSSATGFAQGSVALLDALGCVTHLSFGAENADLSLLSRAASLSRVPADLGDALQQHLHTGLSYAAAVQQAVQSVDAEAGALLSAPNNTLAIEYLCALTARNSTMHPLAIPRIGGAHDSADTSNDRPSASLLREILITDGLSACRSLMPPAAFEVLQQAIQEGAAPIRLAACDQAILAHLRRLTPEQLAAFAGGGDGLENRLYQAIRENTDFRTICAAAQTRRYPLARVRRALLRAWLDLPEALVPAADYVRVLAIGAQGRTILRQLQQTCVLPVIIKPVTERALPPALQPALTRDALADDLYALAYPDTARHIAGNRYRATPAVCT